MRALADIPVWVYKALLVFTTVVWGFSYLVGKDVLEAVPPVWSVAIRNLVAGVLFGLVLLPRLRRCLSPRLLGAGMLLGLFDFGGSFTQTLGLANTTPGVNAFLTATYCVIVPFAWWAIARRRPTAANLMAAVIVLCGIWLVSVNREDGALTLGFGEGVTLVCALMYAIHIVLVARLSRRHDVLALTVVQFLTEGLLALGVGLAAGNFPGLAVFTPGLVAQFAFMAVICTVVCFAIQNASLAYVPPAQASLLLSLESVFGVMFSVLLYGEQLTARLVAGFALIFAGILVGELAPAKRDGR